MNKLRAEQLLDKYLQGNASKREEALVHYWLVNWVEKGEGATGGGMEDEIDAYDELQERRDVLKAEMWEVIAAAIAEDSGFELSDDGNRTRRLWPRVAGVAAAVAAIVFGVWLYRYEIASQARNDGMVVNDVAPGKYGATITLADGKVIQLDSAKRGVVVGGAAGVAGLSYEDGSEIASEAAQPRNDEQGGNDGKGGNGDHLNPSLGGGTTKQSLTMLTATTAKGQTYSFTLPDGTKVWLNADSKLEFPAQFSGKERRILLHGEAYFAVKHNDRQPFRVVSKMANGNGQVVEDIGTEFNISAYADEGSVKTTLVEGAASVSSLLSTSSLRAGEAARKGADEIASEAAQPRNDGKGGLQSSLQGEIASEATQPRNDGKKVMLTPNQQATFMGGGIKVRKVDVEREIAWKNGDFIFSNERLGDIMVELSRWYNVEVSYANESLKDIQLGGFVSRSKNISAVLKMMKLTKRVDFQIKDRKIIVIPYKSIN